jgi:uncharacterized membrane protein
MHARLPKLLLWLLILTYAILFGALSIQRHDAFMTHTRDLGNMDQPIWNTLHGRILEETRGDGRQSTRLTDHFEPIFIPLALVFLLWDNVKSLLLLQTIFIALGALPTYWLARERFARPADPAAGRWLALAFSAAYLLFPALEAANLAEFHAVPLAVPLLLFAYYFGRRGQAAGFWTFALLALTVKEDIALIVFMLGLYFLIKGPRRAWGLGLAGLSLAWFALATFVVIPYFGRQVYAGLGNSIYFSRYGELGNGPAQIALTLLRRPALVFSTLLTADRLLYLAGLLASVGFLALLDPLTSLIALPPLALNLLSNYPAMYSGEMHYSAPAVPFLVAGAVGGAGWLHDRLTAGGRLRPTVARWGIAVWLLLCSLSMQAMRGYTPLSLRFQAPAVTEHHRLLARFAAQIPTDAPLSTTPSLFPHFSHRTRIHQFPVIADAEYILLDVTSATDMHPNDFRHAYEEARAAGFGLVDAADGYILLRRGADGPAALPAAFYSFVRRPAAPLPQYRYQIDFGDSLRFLGYTLLDDPVWHMTRVQTFWQVLRRPDAPSACIRSS